MNRRNFILSGGVLSGAILLSITPLNRVIGHPVEAKYGNQRFRGTNDGKILVSDSSGKDWKLHTNFGADFSILALTPHATGSLHAQLAFLGHSFELALDPSKAIWRTV